MIILIKQEGEMHHFTVKNIKSIEEYSKKGLAVEEIQKATGLKRMMKMHLSNGKTFNCEWDEEIFLTWKAYNKKRTLNERSKLDT